MTTEISETVNVGTVITKDLADSIRDMAREHERSMAAEIRLALRAWVENADASENRRTA